MTTIQEPTVGRLSVDIVLSNQKDILKAEMGHLSPDQVRRVTVRAVVDSGATYLVIPAAVARKLGLEISRTIKVRYADGRIAERPVAGAVQLSYAGRDEIFSAVVEPDRESALVGAIVMEALDLIVDCVNQRLVPRDPNQIITEIE